MRFLLIFTTFLLAAPAFCGELRVELKGGEARSCTKAHSDGETVTWWRCAGASGDLHLRQEVAGGFQTFQAVGRAAAGEEPRLLDISAVKDGPTALYTAGAFPGMDAGSIPRPDSLNENYLQRKYVESALGEGREDRVKGDETFERIRAELVTAAQASMKTIETAFQSAAVYSVELSNGKTLQCKRGVKAEGVDALTKRDTGCELAACSGVDVNGQTFESLLYHPEAPATQQPLAVLLRDGELGPPVQVTLAKSGEQRLHHALPLPPQQATAVDRFSPEFSSFYLQPGWSDYRQNWAARCNDPAIKRLLDMEKTAQAAAAKAETAQVVDLVNGIFSSRLVRAGSVPGSACQLENGVFLSEEAVKAHEEYFRRFRAAPRAPLSEDEAKAALEKVKAMADVPHAFTESGCEARAHVVANRLKELGLPAGKIWLSGDLFNKALPGEGWRFHVATTLEVKGADGNISKRVLDPTVSKELLTVEQWQVLIGSRGENGTVNAVFPPPHNLTFYSKPAVSYSAAEVFLPQVPPAAERLAETLAEAKATNERNLQTLRTRENPNAR